MTLRERYEGVLDWFVEHRPDADTELHYRTPYELVVAVILSAQCTDKRVNLVTPGLFEHFPTAESMAAATPEQVYERIKSCSYPNNKAKNLVGMARTLVQEYGGELPHSREELMKLPGVGRKTANVVAAVLYDRPVMAVDTHVYRVSRRIGLVPQTANTPLKVELALMRHIPSTLVPRAHHWLILHGRYVCTARTPKCSECGISEYCRSYGKYTK